MGDEGCARDEAWREGVAEGRATQQKVAQGRPNVLRFSCRRGALRKLSK